MIEKYIGISSDYVIIGLAGLVLLGGVHRGTL